MGESPQEKAARQQSAALGDLAQTYRPGGTNSYLSRMADINPYISSALTSLDKSATDARAYGSAQLGGIRGSTGSALVEGGVAPGSTINSAFLTAISPAIGEISKFIGETEQKKAGVQMSAADLIKTLMLGGDQTMMQLLGQQGNRVGSMKDSTLTGDILGVGQSLAQIGAGVFGMGGMFPGGLGEFDTSSLVPGPPQLVGMPSIPPAGTGSAYLRGKPK